MSSQATVLLAIAEFLPFRTETERDALRDAIVEAFPPDVSTDGGQPAADVAPAPAVSPAITVAP